MLAWKFTTGGVVWSSPAVVNGVVYVGSLDNNTYALNATTGAQLWKLHDRRRRVVLPRRRQRRRLRGEP
jgi:outer membrane protein assembly factor BamB